MPAQAHWGGVEPAWASAWLKMSSQSSVSGASPSLRELHHGLGQVPLRAMVLFRPLSGPSHGYVFEASGAGAHRDDEDSSMYCGVTYNYNATHIRIYAPTKNNLHSSGLLFCAGQLARLSLHTVNNDWFKVTYRLYFNLQNAYICFALKSCNERTGQLQ